MHFENFQKLRNFSSTKVNIFSKNSKIKYQVKILTEILNTFHVRKEINYIHQYFSKFCKTSYLVDLYNSTMLKELVNKSLLFLQI